MPVPCSSPRRSPWPSRTRTRRTPPPAAWPSSNAPSATARAPATAPGPGLKGVFGRRAGAKEGFIYSPAMKKSAVTWDETTLAAFLADPRAVVPGTTMATAATTTPRNAPTWSPT